MDVHTEPGRRLRVLIIAPISLPISQHLKYAGTERIIAGLHEEFSKHPDVDFIVAATGDSDVPKQGRLIYIYPKALWSLRSNERQIIDPLRALETHFMFCMEYALRNNVDIIHDHAGLIESNAYHRMRHKFNIPVLVTIHGGVHLMDSFRYRAWRAMQREGRSVYFAAISRSQRRQFEDATGVRFLSVVHNGVPVAQLPFVDKQEKQDYLFWIGRIASDKGADLAAKLAKATGRPLIMAGEVHTPNKKFYEREVRPYITRFIEGETYEEQEESRNRLVDRLLRGERVVEKGEVLFIGPLDDRQKGVLYSHAYAQIVLNRWEEPFGLVLPEAMACGTPVIGTRRGSIPEIVVDKKTGFVLPMTWIDLENSVVDEDDLITRATKALEKVPQLEPRDCREHVQKYYSISTTAKGYLEVYSEVLRLEREALKERSFSTVTE